MLPARHSPNQNHLLAALPDLEYATLSPHLEPCPLALGEMLYEPGQRLHHAYFPTSAVVSLHYVTASGAAAETAGVGNEGMVGVSLYHGRRLHTQLGRRADGGPRVSPGAPPPEAGLRGSRSVAASVAALYAGTDGRG